MAFAGKKTSESVLLDSDRSRFWTKILGQQLSSSQKMIWLSSQIDAMEKKKWNQREEELGKKQEEELLPQKTRLLQGTTKTRTI